MATPQDLIKNDRCGDCDREVSRIITGRHRVAEGFICGGCFDKRRTKDLNPTVIGALRANA